MTQRFTLLAVAETVPSIDRRVFLIARVSSIARVFSIARDRRDRHGLDFCGHRLRFRRLIRRFRMAAYLEYRSGMDRMLYDPVRRVD